MSLPGGPPRDFDPDGPGGDGLYGVPCSLEDALVHVISVPWQATASYGRGTRHGPAAVLQASVQVDLEDLDFGPVWRAGLGWICGEDLIGSLHDAVEADALAVIDAGGTATDPGLLARAARVTEAGNALHEWVRGHADAAFSAGRVPAVLGGDHSVPYGLIAAAAERHPGLGVLHIDAHADLREAYLGFEWSHASIFHNVLSRHPEVARLVGVGWRDMGRAEAERIRSEGSRIRAWTEPRLAASSTAGVPWDDVVDAIVEELPPVVHLSIDIDGLDPVLCPHTGTPVPGGLSWREVVALIRAVAARRRIVSFDLCEVSPGPVASVDPDNDAWDAIVGARLLYKLCGAAVASTRRHEGVGPQLAPRRAALR